MKTLIGRRVYNLNLLALYGDLVKEGYTFLDLSMYGELLIAQPSRSGGTLVEQYIAREPGSGATNHYWGDAPNGYEFCGSYNVPEVIKGRAVWLHVRDKVIPGRDWEDFKTEYLGSDLPEETEE